MENLQVARAAPTPANVTVGRPREYLTEREVEKLMDAARGNRWGHRDATAILMAYRHGLRASELVALRWDDIDFQTGKLRVRRAKGRYGHRWIGNDHCLQHLPRAGIERHRPNSADRRTLTNLHRAPTL
jgi:integrase